MLQNDINCQLPFIKTEIYILGATVLKVGIEKFSDGSPATSSVNKLGVAASTAPHTSPEVCQLMTHDITAFDICNFSRFRHTLQVLHLIK